jgi:hypothetical protein
MAVCDDDPEPGPSPELDSGPGVEGRPEGEAAPVLEEITSALARLSQPELTGFPPEQVRLALADLFGPMGLRPEWLTWLRRRIREQSGDTVALEDADRDEFAWLSKEWGAVYQRLVAPDATQLVIIGQSMPPFLFVPAKPGPVGLDG